MGVNPVEKSGCEEGVDSNPCQEGPEEKSLVKRAVDFFERIGVPGIGLGFLVSGPFSIDTAGEVVVAEGAAEATASRGLFSVVSKFNPYASLLLLIALKRGTRPRVEGARHHLLLTVGTLLTPDSIRESQLEEYLPAGDWLLEENNLDIEQVGGEINFVAVLGYISTKGQKGYDEVAQVLYLWGLEDELAELDSVIHKVLPEIEIRIPDPTAEPFIEPGTEVEEEGEEEFLWEIDVVAQSEGDDDSEVVEEPTPAEPDGVEAQPEGDAERADELIKEAISLDPSIAHLFRRDSSPDIAAAAQAVIPEARVSDPVFDEPSFDQKNRDAAAEKLAKAAQIYEGVGDLDRAAVLYERLLRLTTKQRLHYLTRLYEIYSRLNRPIKVSQIEGLILAHDPDAYTTLVLDRINAMHEHALEIEDGVLMLAALVEYTRLLLHLKDRLDEFGDGFERLIEILHEKGIYHLESHAREAYAGWQNGKPDLQDLSFENYLLAIEAAYRSDDMGRVMELLERRDEFYDPSYGGVGEGRMLITVMREVMDRWSRELPLLFVLVKSHWSGSLDKAPVGSGE